MFNNIQKEIDEALQNRQSETPKQYKSTIMSVPGSEQIIASTNNLDFMICESAGDYHRKRYCIVHKNTAVRFNGQWTNSDGYPVSIVTKVVFEDIVALVNTAFKRVQSAEQKLAMVTSERDMYKLTIDALRSNGVID